MKVVLDTNVLLSAFASRGLCEAVLEMCLSSHDMVLSEQIAEELARNLTSKIKLPRRQVDEIVSFLREQAAFVEPVEVPPGSCRDATDLAVLGTALAAGAECLVTGDKDLLEIKKFGDVQILSPRAFHDISQ